MLTRNAVFLHSSHITFLGVLISITDELYIPIYKVRITATELQFDLLILCIKNP